MEKMGVGRRKCRSVNRVEEEGVITWWGLLKKRM